MFRLCNWSYQHTMGAMPCYTEITHDVKFVEGVQSIKRVQVRNLVTYACRTVKKLDHFADVLACIHILVFVGQLPMETWKQVFVRILDLLPAVGFYTKHEAKLINPC